ncbi:hypothetical protein DDE19_34325 [Micromonospora ureilytica]|uniref:Uncharacterized protein n=1 Tax=Micromonospora ureilytica TaxID=709868 RepID=A0A3N9X6R9_9ACTN|nr:hypothetical protein DDE19_34325 [Micromonospora ureilytica]
MAATVGAVLGDRATAFDVMALGWGAVALGLGTTALLLGRGVFTAIGGRAPVRTVDPLASRGSTRSQPGRNSTPSVKVPPSGCFLPMLSWVISRNLLPLPRVRRAMSYRYSRWPLTGGPTT